MMDHDQMTIFPERGPAYGDQEATRCDLNKETKLSQLFDQRFQTREELIYDVQKYFSAQGYATSIKNSKKDKYVTIGCDRGGCYRDRHHIPIETRERKTSSRLINCPFQIHGKRHVDGFWKLEMRNNSHNHEPSSDMSGHPSCRRLSEKEITSVGDMTMSGIAPRQIISSLRLENPNLQAVSRTVYNMKTKMPKENLAGRTVIQALFDELSQGGFAHNVEHDNNGSLTHLFFAHPTSITLSKNYSTVFVMDCTYKTNRYKMPLLDIIGMSSFNSSFYSCFAFLKREREEDYIWALKMFSNMLGPDCLPSVIVTDRELALMNVIQVVFPTTVNLLCVWHIEKNILSKCKPHFDVQDDWEIFVASWNAVIRSQNEMGFEEAWKLFQLFYKEKKYVINYIQKTWFPFRKLFVNAWTEKYQHFGNRVSSRAEGAHSKLKKYLQVSTGDFHQVKKKICLAVENEFQEIKMQLFSERLRVLHTCNIDFFKEVVQKISMFAMGKLFKQYELIKFERVPLVCTGHFMATMGLPCAHKMREWKEGVIPLNAIHPQWRIDTRTLSCSDYEMNKGVELKELLNEFEDRYQQWPSAQKENAKERNAQLISASVPSLLEPSIDPHKGRQSNTKKRKGLSSTRRDPSNFEIVEATRRCTICRGVGHNSSTCQRKGDANDQNTYSFSNPINDENVSGLMDLNMIPEGMGYFSWD